MFRKLGFIVLANFICLTAAHLSAASLVHSPLKDYTGPECGVKSFVQSERRECGIDHFVSRRDPLCGPERFNSGPDLSCNGSDAGGRQVKPTATVCHDRGVCINWSNVTASTVQGGEDLRVALSSSYRSWNDFGGQTEGNVWVKELKNWTCKLQASVSPQYSFATVVCTAKQYLATCEREKFGVALHKSCARSEFGEVFKRCDDPSRVESYNSCQLRKTATELNAYIDATSSNIAILAQQLATAQGNYVLGSKQAKLASCLIARYETDFLYEDIVRDLKNNYSAMFGLEYDPSQFDCENTQEKVEYTYQGKSCSNATSAEVSAKLAIPTLAVNERYFYELCQQKQTVDSLTSWFNFQIAETDLLLGDLVARSNPEVASKLQAFRANLKKVKSEDIKCENCRVTTVEASKTVPSAPVTPPAASEEQIDVIYDGEAHPFSAGQGWDITASNIENSSNAPASGSHHLRATLNNANYWAAASYVIDNWMAKDFSAYKKIRFKAKSNKVTKAKLFFVSMDKALESNHIEFQSTTDYQSFEFDLDAVKTNEFNLNEVQGIVFAVSQPGKATFLIDIDDIQMIKDTGIQTSAGKAQLLEAFGARALSFTDNFVTVSARIENNSLLVSLVRRMESTDFRLNLDSQAIEAVKTRYMSAPETRNATPKDEAYQALVQELKNAAGYLPNSSEGSKALSAYLSAL